MSPPFGRPPREQRVLKQAQPARARGSSEVTACGHGETGSSTLPSRPTSRPVSAPTYTRGEIDSNGSTARPCGSPRVALPGGACGRVGQAAGDLDWAEALAGEALKRDRCDRVVLVVQGGRRAQHPRRIGAGKIGAEGVGESAVGALEVVRRQRPLERPIRMHAAWAGLHEHSGLRFEPPEQVERRVVVAVDPQRAAVIDRGAAARTLTAGCAAYVDVAVACERCRARCRRYRLGRREEALVHPAVEAAMAKLKPARPLRPRERSEKRNQALSR